jgi:Holliday junction resolvase-like predicted endonuclease
MTKHIKSLLAEDRCCTLLQRYGYLVIYRRFKTKTGEIDVVAIKDQTLHMFEVKYRSESLNLARLSVLKSYKRMYQTYLAYLHDLYPNLYPRFRYFAMSGNSINVGDIDADIELDCDTA